MKSLACSLHSLRLEDLLDGLPDGFTGCFDGRTAGEANTKSVIKAGGDDANRNKSRSVWASWLRWFFRSEPLSPEVEGVWLNIVGVAKMLDAKSGLGLRFKKVLPVLNLIWARGSCHG